MSLAFSSAQEFCHRSATIACFCLWQRYVLIFMLVFNLPVEGILQQQGQAHELVTQP